MPKFLPKTYQYIHVESLSLGIWMCLILVLPLSTFAQPTSVSNQAAYYDQLEERARSLSEKLAAFTDTKKNPVQRYENSPVLNSDVDLNSSFVKIADENESISISSPLNPHFCSG